MSLLSFDSIDFAAASDLGGASDGGPKISLPLSSLHFASESCFLVLLSASLSRDPLNSRCFATSGRVVGFFGEIFSSVLNEIWLMPFAAC